MPEKYLNKYRIASARAPWWDYSTNAPYFITICTQGMKQYFGQIHNGLMEVSQSGEVAYQCWTEIPDHFPYVELDAFVVMPNHVHGIILLKHPEQAGAVNEQIAEYITKHGIPVETMHASSLLGGENGISEPTAEYMSSISPKPGSLHRVIGSYKSAVTKLIHRLNLPFGWQTRYHDHIIRDDKSYFFIKEYILNNPAKWQEDKFFTNTP